MENTLLNTILVHFCGVCQSVGLDGMEVLVSLAGVGITVVTGAASWVAKKLAWGAASVGWRGVRGTWRWARKTPEPSELCRAILSRLDLRSATLEKDADGLERLHTPGNLTLRLSGRSGDGFLCEVLIGNRDALPHIRGRDRKTIERRAKEIAKRLAEENAAYEEMAAIDALAAKQPTDAEPQRVSVASVDATAMPAGWHGGPACYPK